MTLQKYIIGFVLSLVLTLIAYLFVTEGSIGGMALLLILSVLALIQMVIQLKYFLHLGEETGHQFKLLSFVFMGLILFIVVAGSLWIMKNLDYNMMNMSPDQKSDYMMTQHDKGF